MYRPHAAHSQRWRCADLAPPLACNVANVRPCSAAHSLATSAMCGHAPPLTHDVGERRPCAAAHCSRCVPNDWRSRRQRRAGMSLVPGGAVAAGTFVRSICRGKTFRTSEILAIVHNGPLPGKCTNSYHPKICINRDRIIEILLYRRGARASCVHRLALAYCRVCRASKVSIHLGLNSPSYSRHIAHD